MNVRAVDFVQIQVRDMDRALGFYRDALGMPVGEAWGDEWVELAAGDTTIALAAEVEGAGIALSVDSVSDAIEELKAKGIEVVCGTPRQPVVRQRRDQGPGRQPGAAAPTSRRHGGVIGLTRLRLVRAIARTRNADTGSVGPRRPFCDDQSTLQLAAARHPAACIMLVF